MTFDCSEVSIKTKPGEYRVMQVEIDSTVKDIVRQIDVSQLLDEIVKMRAWSISA